MQAKYACANDTANWMQIAREILKDRCIARVILPGSHDSGAYELKHRAGRSITCGCLLECCCIRNIVTSWSITQGRDIYNQLMAGCRYLDLRVAWIESERTFRFQHTLLGVEIRDILYQVASFLKNSREEFLILDFQHFFNVGASEHLALLDMVMRILGTVSQPPAKAVDTDVEIKVETDTKSKQPFHRGVVVPVARWGDSLEVLWGTEHRVFIVYGLSSVPPQFADIVAPKSRIVSPWAQGGKEKIPPLPAQLETRLQKFVQENSQRVLTESRRSCDAEAVVVDERQPPFPWIFVLQVVLAPVIRTIVNAVCCCCCRRRAGIPTSLRDLALHSTNPHVLQMLRCDEWRQRTPKLNVVMLDFAAESAELVTEIIHLNYLNVSAAKAASIHNGDLSTEQTSRSCTFTSIV